MIITNKCVQRIVKKQKSACESIESVSDIDTICHRCNNQYEERNIKISYIYIWKKWNTDSRLFEFKVKPKCSKCPKKKKKGELHSGRKSLGSSDFFYIQIIIDESNSTNSKECKKSEVGFISIPE